VEAARALGADHVINYRTDDFVAAIRLITAGTGVNVILDMVGGPYVERNWRAAAVEGRIVQIANLIGLFGFDFQL
jgi:NADPH2:quinone reductase